jgi:hypothetical protein
MIPSFSNASRCILSFASCISDDHLPIYGTSRAELISLKNRPGKSFQITSRLYAFHIQCVHLHDVQLQ